MRVTLDPQRMRFNPFQRNLEISEKELREILSEEDTVSSTPPSKCISTDIGELTQYQEWDYLLSDLSP